MNSFENVKKKKKKMLYVHNSDALLLMVIAAQKNKTNSSPMPYCSKQATHWFQTNLEQNDGMSIKLTKIK